MALNELETHRRLISSQIKREVQASKDEITSRMQMAIDSLSSRIAGQDEWIRAISKRLMDLSLIENKLINETETMKKRNDILFDRLSKMKHLVEMLHPGLRGYEF